MNFRELFIQDGASQEINTFYANKTLLTYMTAELAQLYLSIKPKTEPKYLLEYR